MSDMTIIEGMPASVYRVLLMGEVNDFRDEEGRPIGEIRASDAARESVATEYRRCPYTGSRGQAALPLNLSALRQATREWKAVLGTVHCLRSAYAERHQGAAMTLLDLARISAAGLTLPSWLMLRTPDGIADGAVPVFVAATHKMFAGVFSLCKNLLLVQVAMGEQYDRIPADADALYRFAEVSGMLVGKTGKEVCAGAPGMIADVLGLLARGTCMHVPDQQPVRALLRDTGRFLDYAEASADLMLWALVHALRTRELSETLAAELALTPQRRTAPQADGWFDRALAHLASFEANGFGAGQLPLPLANPDTAETLALGIVRLFCDLCPDEARGPLFCRLVRFDDEASDALAAWVDAGLCVRGGPALKSRTIAATLARCLHAERQALQLFGRIQARIHRAAGRAEPCAPSRATLETLFGPPASACFARVFGIVIDTSTDACVLRDGARQLRIE